MDDESNQILREILNQQKEQTELLRKHLVRIRFSLRTLLLLLTLVSVGLGMVIYNTNSVQKTPPTTTPPPPIFLPARPVVMPPATPQNLKAPPYVLPESTPKPTVGFLNLHFDSADR
jgi:hypothetical protein